MISSNVVLDPDRLAREVEYFGNQGAFVWDWETIDSSPGADDRGVPSQNVVTWVSMATHGRAIVIPMGHPLGTRVIGETKEPRADKNGKIRMFRVPVYEAPPEQLTRGDVFPELNRLFNDPSISQAAHGATFDAATGAKYNGGKIPAGNIYCTIVMRWLTNENVKRYGLKYCAKDVWKFAYDDEEVGRRVEKHPFGKVAHYAYCDAKVAWLEYLRRMRELKDEGLLDLLQLETDLVSVLSYMRTKGVQIDYGRLLSLRDELTEREERQAGEVWNAAGKKFNLNAPRQKQQILFGRTADGGQGLRPWKLTDSAKDRKQQARDEGQDFKPALTDWSTDEEAIEGYRHTNPVVDKLLNWTETHKVLSTYVTGYLGDETAKDKPNRVFRERIYPDFVQYGAATGRFSCRAPNLQNVPRPDTDLGKLIRGMFVAEPGRQLVVADYGQIELVLLAHFIGKGAFYDGFFSGIDPHVMTAAMALSEDPAILQALVNEGDPDAKHKRQAFGKSINFATVYGAGISKLASMMGVSMDEAKHFKAMYDDNAPEVARYRNWVIAEAKDQRPAHVVTLLGRKRRVPGVFSREDGLRMYSERQLFNAKIQGSSADLTKLAMVNFFREMHDGWDLHLTVHDELVISAPTDEAELARDVLVNCMAGPEMRELLRVPFEVDAKIVTRWSEAK